MPRQFKSLATMLPLVFLLADPFATSRGGAKFEIGEHVDLELGIWGQVWYQHVGIDEGDGDLNDFMIRRMYLYLNGHAAKNIGFFTQISGDRIGQQGLDNPGQGLGSSVAVRDLWLVVDAHEAFKLQAGRMYVPFTRSFGTTSPKTLLTLDVPFLQGGVRGTTFYASKVGRDDGVAVWGNPLDGRVQYRFMASEGVEGAGNPEDKLRYSGRVSVYLFDPELNWYNWGNYLGEKNVLAIGGGIDYQPGLTLAERPDQDNFGWTLDAFFDHPMSGGAVTVEAAFIHIDNSTQTHSLSELAAGDDADNWYIQGAYLLSGKVGAGRIQPYARYESVSPEDRSSTGFLSAGVNYLLKGHNAKFTFDFSRVDQDEPTPAHPDQTLVTIQAAFGI